jgi:small subunit ribosomal protein S8
MSMSDPIADMLTRIRNAVRLGAEVVVMPSSKLKAGIAAALQREGFIEGFSQSASEKNAALTLLQVNLKYGPNGEQVIQFLDRVSKPGRRVYAGATGLPRVLSGMGCSIVSTSRGVKSDRECRAEKVGGEVLCRVG